MPASPGIISYAETVFNTTTTPKTTVISWNAGDIVIYVAGCENNLTLPVPTGTGITFVSQKTNGAAGSCATQLAAAAPTAAGSSVTISGTLTGGSLSWGYGIFVVRGACRFGTSVEQHTATKTVSLTPESANSTIIWGCFDFEAAGAVTPNLTVPEVITRHSEDVGTSYSIGIFSMLNQTSKAAVGYGGVFGGSTGPYSLVAIELVPGGTTMRSIGRRLRPAPFKPGTPKVFNRF